MADRSAGPRRSGCTAGSASGPTPSAALRQADLLIGASRQFELLPADLPGERVELWGALDEVLDLAASVRRRGNRCACWPPAIPASSGWSAWPPPGSGPGRLAVHPAPSSVALAFARVGLNWDDAVVVSAHGRPLDPAVEAIVGHPKVAVLRRPDQPPEALGRALVDAGCGPSAVTVCSRLGEPDEEAIVSCDLAGLAAEKLRPALSVVVARTPRSRRCRPRHGLSWG